MLKREQLLEWQSHPVTEELKSNLEERIDEVKDNISAPGMDPRAADFLRGIAFALKEVFNWHPETESEGQDD